MNMMSTLRASQGQHCLAPKPFARSRPQCGPSDPDYYDDHEDHDGHDDHRNDDHDWEWSSVLRLASAEPRYLS